MAPHKLKLLYAVVKQRRRQRADRAPSILTRDLPCLRAQTALLGWRPPRQPPAGPAIGIFRFSCRFPRIPRRTARENMSVGGGKTRPGHALPSGMWVVDKPPFGATFKRCCLEVLVDLPSQPRQRPAPPSFAMLRLGVAPLGGPCPRHRPTRSPRTLRALPRRSWRRGYTCFRKRKHATRRESTRLQTP